MSGGRRWLGGSDKRHITVQAGEHSIELELPTEQADALERLVNSLNGLLDLQKENPAEFAARATSAIDEDDPAVGFARVALAHTGMTGDVEGPLRGLGMYMAARDAVFGDLAALLLWLHVQGQLDDETAEDLGLREGSVRDLVALHENMPQPYGADDVAFEAAVRGQIRRFEKQLAGIAAAEYPNADPAQLWRLRHLLVEFAQANELDSLDVAHRLLRAEHPEELEMMAAESDQTRLRRLSALLEAAFPDASDALAHVTFYEFRRAERAYPEDRRSVEHLWAREILPVVVSVEDAVEGALERFRVRAGMKPGSTVESALRKKLDERASNLLEHLTLPTADMLDAAVLAHPEWYAEAQASDAMKLLSDAGEDMTADEAVTECLRIEAEAGPRDDLWAMIALAVPKRLADEMLRSAEAGDDRLPGSETLRRLLALRTAGHESRDEMGRIMREELNNLWRFFLISRTEEQTYWADILLRAGKEQEERAEQSGQDEQDEGMEPEEEPEVLEPLSGPEVEDLVAEHLKGIGVERNLTVRRTDHGWLVDLEARAADLRGKLPTYFVPSDRPHIYRFPGHASIDAMKSACPHLEERDRANPLNRSWRIG